MIAPAECGLPNNNEPSDIDPLFIVSVGTHGPNTTQFNSPTVPVPQVPNPSIEDDILTDWPHNPYPFKNKLSDQETWGDTSSRF